MQSEARQHFFYAAIALARFLGCFLSKINNSRTMSSNFEYKIEKNDFYLSRNYISYQADVIPES